MSDPVKRTPEQDMAKVESIALKVVETCLDCPVHDVDATFTPLEAIIRRRLRELAEAETLISQQKSAIQSMQINYNKQYDELIAVRKQRDELKETRNRHHPEQLKLTEERDRYKVKADEVDKIKEVIKHYGITSGETLWQQDDIATSSLEIIEKICDIVGYAADDCQNIEHNHPCLKEEKCLVCGISTCSPNYAYHVCIKPKEDDKK